MTTLVLELSPEIYERLNQEAIAMGETVQGAAQKFLGERLNVSPRRYRSRSERDEVTEALRAAGLLTELGPEMQRRAARSTATLEEVQAALSVPGAKPLSEIIIEMRGPKE